MREARALRRAVDGAGIDRSANPAAWSLTLGFGAGMAEALFWTAPTERLKILRQAKAGEGVGRVLAVRRRLP